MKQNNGYLILVSAFEKFGQHKVNASEIVLNYLGKKKLSDGTGLQRCLLPVQWQRSFTVLKKHIRLHKPRLIILLGESGRKKISIERKASPRNAAIADNLGKYPQKQNTMEKEVTLAGNLTHVRKLKKAFTEQGLPCAYSDDAGNYLCNFVYYQTLQRYAQNAEIVFIHIPSEFADTRAGIASLKKCAHAIVEFAEAHAGSYTQQNKS